MRILHTSDWHLGRTFHGASILDGLCSVLESIAALVEELHVDVVLVAGDVFDHSAPAAQLYRVLDDTVRQIRRAGAQVVVISGNHDNAARLGAKAEWAAFGGVHFLTADDAFRSPVEISDEHGVVDFYGIPFLEPVLVEPQFETLASRTQQAVMQLAADEIREQIQSRGHRSVALAHTFVGSQAFSQAGTPETQGADGVKEEDRTAASETSVQGADRAEGEAERLRQLNADLQRDITSGGVDVVSTETFSGIDYVALGHIHSRKTLNSRVRYSGAPLHFSFGEAGKPRGVWIVDLDQNGLADVTWRDIPVPRPLDRLRGNIEDLLTDDRYKSSESSWVEAELTDRLRPVDAMRRLKERFPYCVHVKYAQSDGVRSTQKYTEKTAGKSFLDICDEFLKFVRDDVGASTFERDALERARTAAQAREASENAPGEKR